MHPALSQAVNRLDAAFRGLRRPLSDALALERLSAEEIQVLQLEKLRRLLDHAARWVPFWRQRFATVGFRPEAVRSAADLAALVPLEKSDLKKHGATLLTHGQIDPAWFQNASGGSTGTPVVFYHDIDFRRRMIADQLRHVTWMEVDCWAPRAYVWGADRDGRDHAAVWGRLKDELRGALWLNTFRSTDNDYRAFAELCGRRDPPLLVGYASSLEHFARVLKRDLEGGGEITWRPRAIQSSAERLVAETRNLLKSVFGAPVYDRYGSREMGNAAHECGAHSGLHVSMERVLVEIVRGGVTAPNGEEGEILVTVLDNLAMPLIRYRVGDLARKVAGPPCPCGRPYERIEVTAGRTSDLITSPAGRRIHGEYFTHLFYGLEGIGAFRIVQETRERLVLSVVRSSSWRDNDLEPVLKGIRDIDPGFQIEVQFVEEIPVLPSGKMCFTASKVPIEW